MYTKKQHKRNKKMTHLLQNWHQNNARSQFQKNYHLGLVVRKACLQGFANNKGADQTVRMRRLISAFVNCLFKLAYWKGSTVAQW